MIIEKMDIEGLHIIKPLIQTEDNYMQETYNSRLMSEAGLNLRFVQENQSFSYKNVLRGLHVQKKVPQGKLVRVIDGKIFDVVIDMREGSKTYLKWTGVELSSDNKLQFYIEEGFAHGFLVLSDTALVSYKVSDYWSKDNDFGIRWNDKTIGIEWPFCTGEQPIVAKRDMSYPDLIKK